MDRQVSRGCAIVLSGPSGSGKTTLIRKIQEDFPDLKFSISATTRPMRTGEQDGREYHFLSRSRFMKMIQQNDFIEYAEYGGNLYGTLIREVVDPVRAGKNVILDVNIEGHRNLRKNPNLERKVLSFFITPPSIEELESRLRKREDGMAESEIQRRLSIAKEEMNSITEFNCPIVNHDAEAAREQIRKIIGERLHI